MIRNQYMTADKVRTSDGQIDTMSGRLSHHQTIFQMLRAMAQMPTVHEDHGDTVFHCQTDLAECSPAAADSDHGLRRQDENLIASLPQAGEYRDLDAGIGR